MKLVIYDLTGREAAILINETLNAGDYIKSFDGTGLASGVYFYRIEAEEFTLVKKMVLIK